MFTDEVEVSFQAGNGGSGRASFYPPPMRGPDGGNGGKGGDVFLTVTKDTQELSKFASKHLWEAEKGQRGEDFKKTGRNGKDLIISIPTGSLLINTDTNEQFELIDLNEPILICKGGDGGRGNFEFRSSTNTTPKYSEPGFPGEKKHFKIILRLIADYGLIGLPNAGKSSLLNEITAANVKTAAYPFTTLEPNLGVLDGKVIADIPGLIAGASEGRGLGIKFLKHIEKVKLLLHCIPSSSEDVARDYQTIRAELKKFNPELLQKKEVILLTKSDLVDQKTLNNKIKILKKANKQIYPISIFDFDSIESLKKIF